jgi:hypothetical protein
MSLMALRKTQSASQLIMSFGALLLQTDHGDDFTLMGVFASAAEHIII